MNKKIRTEVAVGIILVIAIIISGLIWAENKKQNLTSYTAPITSEKASCPTDTKQCPDGTYIKRAGTNCAFSPCPIEKEQSTATEHIYTNNELGFQLIFPDGWEFKDNFIDAGFANKSVYFYLAAQNKKLLSVMPGYEYIFTITKWPLAVWNRQVKSSPCGFACKILYKDNKYVFVYDENYEIHDEKVKALFTESAVNKIIASFKVVSIKKGDY